MTACPLHGDEFIHWIPDTSGVPVETCWECFRIWLEEDRDIIEATRVQLALHKFNEAHRIDPQ